jgi:solute carrier family 25 oxoglutarate transporter 11
LYAGLSGGILRQLSYGMVRMGAYSALLDRSKRGSDGPVPFASKLLMGSAAGGLGAFVGTPAELSIVRLAADSKFPPEQRRGYVNAFDCLRRVAREEGLRQLWRGASVTVVRVVRSWVDCTAPPGGGLQCVTRNDDHLAETTDWLRRLTD